MKKYSTAFVLLILFLLLSLLFEGNYIIFNLVYIFMCVFMIIKTLLFNANKKVKTLLIVAFLTIMVVQIVFLNLTVFAEHTSIFHTYLSRIIATIFVMIPYAVAKIFTFRQLSNTHLPSIQEISTISFEELKNNKDRIVSAINIIDRSGKVFSKENMNEILDDLPRHSSFKYISNGSLTEEYFNHAYASLADNNIYIVISNTGSAASEVISIFTQKNFNHVSLAFDEGLETIISYNGGERVYPPGLNHEMLAFFNKKEDSSIIVYKLKADYAQKKKIIDKVKEINTDGSAYNLLGLLLKYSHKPNIMFCSQFVYKMLEYAGLAFFNKKAEDVQPTDFVELDYHRKLDFVYEMHLNDVSHKS